MDINTVQNEKTMAELRERIVQYEITLEQQVAKIAALEERIQQLLQERYGKRSEKFNEPHADNVLKIPHTTSLSTVVKLLQRQV